MARTTFGAPGALICRYVARCGLCGESEVLEDNLHATNRVWVKGVSREAAVIARSLGWSQTKTHGWICPRCAARRDPRRPTAGQLTLTK